MNNEFKNIIYDIKNLPPWVEVHTLSSCVVLLYKTESWINFAVMTFESSDDDSENYSAFWVGGGTADPLRELRHSYFGHDDIEGYVFYISRDAIIEGSSFLLNYFDF